MANLPEKNITTVNKVTSIPSNTNVFINANGEFVQANIDDVVSAGNQFKVFNGNLILAQGTSKGYVTDFTGYGNSTQGGEPTPDAPIEILSNGHRGYFDGELLNGVYNNATGAFSSLVFYVCSKNPIPCKEGDKINVKYGVVANAISIVYYDSNMNQVNYVALANVSEIAPTAPANASYFHFSINENGLALTPQTAKHICVTINGMYALIVKNGNKNLWELGDVSGTATVPYTLAKPIPAGTYTMSALVTSTDTDMATSRFIMYDKNAIEIKSLYFNRGARDSQSFTVSSDIYMLRFYASRNNETSTGDALTFADIQLEVGNTMTDYVPHEEQTAYIPLAQPLRGIGANADSVKMIDGLYGEGRKFIELVFDGSDDEGWSGMTTYADRFYIPSSKLSNIKARTKVICSHYSYSNSLATVDYGIYLGGDLNIKNKDITTLADFKASLATNPITVIAELAEEVFTPFADQTPFYSMKTFDGVTLISSDAEMDVEVPMSRAGGVASIGYAKGNLAEIEMQNIKTKLTELQTAVVGA